MDPEAKDGCRFSWQLWPRWEGLGIGIIEVYEIHGVRIEVVRLLTSFCCLNVFVC